MTPNFIKIPLSGNTKISAVEEWQLLKKSHPWAKNSKNFAYKTGVDAGFLVLDIDLLKPHKNEKDGYKQFVKLHKKLDIHTRTVQTQS